MKKTSEEVSPTSIKYQTLVKTLDRICEQAPTTHKRFKPSKGNVGALNNARSRAFIHLYLKAEFGVIDFVTAESFVTEGDYDGGVDAYYLDEKTKTLHLVQSKFRTVEKNFETTEIEADELSKMDLKRIIRGEDKDEQKNPYNGKIRGLQRKLSSIRDFHEYKIEVVILANLKRFSAKTIDRLLEGYEYKIFDFEKTYEKLVLAVCSGSYYDPEEIRISIDLRGKKQHQMDQEIDTTIGTCRVRILFVPTKEIAEILRKYQNSILKFNPRNYLSLKKNEINRKIASSIKDNESNDFALLNNGITMLATKAEVVDPHGDPNKSSLILINPQIINGAQTAYTLSWILSRANSDKSIFESKEVMLRVIEIDSAQVGADKFIEALSDATNQQNKITEADRRSNDPIQVKIQKNIFDDFGYFYSRKRGEFESGIEDGYISRKFVIEREKLIKAYMAYKGRASEARRTSQVLFKKSAFKEFFRSHSNYREMFFAYRCFILLSQKASDRKTKKGTKEILRYGRMAVISAIGVKTSKLEGDIDGIAEERIEKVLGRWPRFMEFVYERKQNAQYLTKGGIDLDNYFKGGTLNSDIKSFFK